MGHLLFSLPFFLALLSPTRSCFCFLRKMYVIGSAYKMLSTFRPFRFQKYHPISVIFGSQFDFDKLWSPFKFDLVLNFQFFFVPKSNKHQQNVAKSSCAYAWNHSSLSICFYVFYISTTHSLANIAFITRLSTVSDFIFL